MPFDVFYVCSHCADPALYEVDCKEKEKEGYDWKEKKEFLCRYCLGCLKTQREILGTVDILKVKPLPQITACWSPKK